MVTEHFPHERKRWASLFKAITSETSLNPATTRQAIWKRNKATLWHYPASKRKYDTPLYLIYSLVNKPTILDLIPNKSLISALNKAGYEVYVIDFGVPGYEDREMTIDDYVLKYIQPGVRKALEHSQGEEITIMGFCLGGTLAAMYAAVASEPLKNLILFVTPVDFSYIPHFELLYEAVKDGTINLSPLIETLGIIPAFFMNYGIRLITSPVYLSPYLSLLEKGHNEQYVQKWSLFNQWARDHIAFPGAAFTQLMRDLIIENKLINGDFTIGGKPAALDQITANLLVIVSTNDELVPLEQALPVVERTGSKDKECIQLPNGHTGLTTGAGLPSEFFHWLASRS